MDNNNGGTPVVEPVQTDNSAVTTPVTPVITPVEAPSAPIAEAPKVEAKAEVKPNSLLEKASTEQQVAEKNYWGNDWKQKMSNGDEKLAKLVDKFKTPQEALAAYRDLQSQFSKTRPIPELAKDATDAQVKEYREQVGIPESWDKYDTNLKDVVIGEQDKPIVEDFLKKAHEMNLKSSEVKNSLQAYFEINNARNAELAKAAESQQAEVEQQLQKEWGSLYKDNLSMITNHLSKEIGTEEVEKLNNAVLPDGTLLINNPKLLNYLLKDAKSNSMSHTVTPNPAQEFTTLMERKAELEKIHETNPKLFYSNPVLGREYQDLLGHEKRLGKK